MALDIKIVYVVIHGDNNNVNPQNKQKGHFITIKWFLMGGDKNTFDML